MKLLTIKKSLLSLAIATFLAGAMPDAKAMDALFIIPNVLTGRGFDMRNVGNIMGQTYRANIADTFALLLVLPFAILDEDAKTITTNKKDLEDLGYKQEEIVKYQKDLESLKDLFSNNKFSSKEEAEAALDSIDLGIIAKEQLRLN